MRIRAARPDEAAALARVHVAGWQWGYRGLLPDAYLDALKPEDREAMWAAALTAGRLVHVAEQDDGIVGIAFAGLSRDHPEEGELFVLYQLVEVAGTGVGRALLAAAVAGLAEAGFAEASLWVLDTNTRARAFYERHGWHPDGGVLDTEIGGEPVREVRYRTRC